MTESKLGDSFLDFLVDEGFTHCFFLAGGNIMHLLDGVRRRFHSVPFVHEVSAFIAAEYFNQISSHASKAFVLVTAGPGLTNCVTGIAGAYLESREVLVVGGQVKSADLALSGPRQLGIQEIDGKLLVDPITVISSRVTDEATYLEFIDAYLNRSGRPGPIFVEWCLDAQAQRLQRSGVFDHPRPNQPSANTQVAPRFELIQEAARHLEGAERPIFLIGSGLNRASFQRMLPVLTKLGVPMQFTWNAADYLSSDHPLNCGRPNTWGQLDANLIIQQSDLLVAVGTRLGMMQTGFAWEEFAPMATIFQVDIDPAELEKGRPLVHYKFCGDAELFLEELLGLEPTPKVEAWRHFTHEIRTKCPDIVSLNSKKSGFVQPQEFMAEICEIAPADAVFTPSSSGGTFTVAMQAMKLNGEQRLVTNKGLASMGYGAAGAIGLALANRSKVAVCIEGDGGFAQNLQELGTAAAQSLNTKFIIFSNNGYASIRMTQRNYFGGNWIGCDSETGLGLPELRDLAAAFGLRYVRVTSDNWRSELSHCFSRTGPEIIEVPIDPDQTYYPKIGSRVNHDGTMTSNPLHRMTPDLDPETQAKVMKYLGVFQ